jgi:hypothetical protein
MELQNIIQIRILSLTNFSFFHFMDLVCWLQFMLQSSIDRYKSKCFVNDKEKNIANTIFKYIDDT